MPHVAAHEVVETAGATLEEIIARHGPPPFRVPLIASPAIRVVLWGWQPGHVTVPHRHPRAEEMFHVLTGRAVFTFGGEGDRTVGPGTILVAPRDVAHAIRVVGDEPFVMLIAVAPNEDAADETIEPADAQAIPVVDGAMTLGEFGRIYFADFDQVRARERTVRVQIVGE